MDMATLEQLESRVRHDIKMCAFLRGYASDNPTVHTYDAKEFLEVILYAQHAMIQLEALRESNRYLEDGMEHYKKKSAKRVKKARK